MEAAFVVIDEDTGGDVHRIDETQSLADAAFADHVGNLSGDVPELDGAEVR
jgi:hypothetical protein